MSELLSSTPSLLYLFLFLKVRFFIFARSKKPNDPIVIASVSYENSRDATINTTVCYSHDTRHPPRTAVSRADSSIYEDTRCNLRGHTLNVGDRDISYRYTANTVGIASLSRYPSPTIAAYSCSWARHTLWQHGRSYVAGMPSAAVPGGATGNTRLDRWHGDRAAQTDPSR